MQWNKIPCTYLKTQFRQVQNVEQTQEVRLQDDMADIGRVLCAWGQVVIRSKQWRSDSVAVSGGISGWVLFAPEDGGPARCVESWLPIQAKWSLPDGSREGTLRISACLKNIDARMLSGRKLLVRASASLLAEAFAPEQVQVVSPEQGQQKMELLQMTYPVTLRKEAGEKVFSMEEQLPLPDAQKLIAWELEPAVTEQTVLGNRIVFKGNAHVHLVYQDGGGKLAACWEQLPFAQYADLEGEYDKEATASCVMAVSSLEPELADGQVTVKCGLIAQYVVLDRVMLQVAEDAYCPNADVQLQKEEIELPVILDRRNQSCGMEQQADGELAEVLDVRFYPEQPVQYREGDVVVVELPATYQLLGYDAEGSLQTKEVSCVQKVELAAAPGCVIYPELCLMGEPSAVVSGGKLRLECPVQLDMQTAANQSISMLTDVRMGQSAQPDPERPSLILCRADDAGLWQIAKSCNSTVEAIRKANQLTADPVPGQLLLVPVC